MAARFWETVAWGRSSSCGQLTDLHRSAAEQVHDPQPVDAGERPDEADLDEIDLGSGVEHWAPDMLEYLSCISICF